MKKIFAIALALVMVLSMASAFAFVGTCGDYKYSCPTVGCGVAKAEVVQFVADNSADGYTESACAGVVKGQNVFFGVKVTFDKDVNEQWYEHAATKLEITSSNVTDTATYDTTNKLKAFTGNKSAADVSGKTFWYNFNNRSLVSSFDPDTCVNEVEALNTRAEVCANVVYDFDGMNLKINYNGFDVTVQYGKTAEYVITVNKGADELKVYVVGGVAKYAVLNGTTVYYRDNGTILAYKNGSLADNDDEIVITGVLGVVSSMECTDVDELMALININFGDCVNASVIKANFGWKNGDAACKTWNKDAQAIVNAECVVMGIPKTGDKSVLAWLF